VIRTSTDYDLAIVGGGLAGCAAAIHALRAVPASRVLVLERGRYPRQKVCGEFLSAEGVALLCEFAKSSESVKNLLRGSQKISVAKIHALNHSAEFPVEPVALSISRFALDAALWQYAQSLGADCRQQIAVTGIEGSAPFQVKTNSGEFSVKAVINAAGRWSVFSPQAAKNGNSKAHWVGLKAHYYEGRAASAVELYFFPHGYCGVQPAGDGVINACAMVRVDAATSMDEVLNLHPALKARSRDWQRLMEPLATAPLLFRKPQPTLLEMMNAGDAAGFIDPFSGNGMTIALQSGAMAGNCMAEFLLGRTELSSALSQYAARYAAEIEGSFQRVAWVRRMLGMPRPAAIAALNLLKLPGIGRMLVQKTRSATVLPATH